MQKQIKILTILCLATSLLACNESPDFAIAPVEDSFGQKITYNNKVDILWVVDNSSSMESSQARLAQQVDQVFSSLNKLKLDYRMAAVTTDMRNNVSSPARPEQTQGRFIGSTKVISSKTSNAKSLFTQMIQPGVYGSSVEEGLAAMKKALSPEMLDTTNKNFLRDDASLVIIFLTDEDDASSGSAQSYIDFLDTIKPSFEYSRAWIANFIGVMDISGECSTYADNPFASAGIEYMELVEASGGISASICTSSLKDALAGVNKRIAEMITSHYFSREPLEETIVVKINGNLLVKDPENGWSYNASQKVLRFHGSGVPAANAKVEIDYKPKNIKD